MRGLWRGRAVGPQAGEAARGRGVAAELGEQHRADFGIVAQPPAQLRPRRRRGLVPQLRGRHAASFAGGRAVVQRVIASTVPRSSFIPNGPVVTLVPLMPGLTPGPTPGSALGFAPNVVDVTSSTIEGGRW